MSTHDCEYCDCAEYADKVYIALDRAMRLENLTHHFDDKGNEYVLISGFKHEIEKLQEMVGHRNV